jgi:hypothetical protein
MAAGESDKLRDKSAGNMECPTFTPTFAKQSWIDVPQLLLVVL